MLRSLFTHLFPEKQTAAPKLDTLLLDARAKRDTADWEAAQIAYKRVLELDARHPEALLATANIAYLLGGRDAAVSAFEDYLAIEPDNLDARNMLGRIHAELGQLHVAIRHYARVREKDSRFQQVAHLILLYSAFDADMDARRRREIHEDWARQNADYLLEAPSVAVARSEDGRRRVGYVSAFFSNHPIADFVAPILRHHDRRKWQVFVYSDVAVPDSVTRALQALNVEWRDCAGLDDADFAAQVRADGIEVLVDLAGHNATNRLLAFARRLAPVQVTGIGYAGTTGLKAMDYRLADPVADYGTDEHYSERLLRLPRCLWCYEPPAAMPDIGPLPAGASGTVTFVSLNAAIKLTEETLVVWARILGRVPDSRLTLTTVVPGSPRQRIVASLERHGVNPSRVTFVPPMPREQFWSLYGQSDIALDTWPCNGGTTTFEALWGGLPVVVLAGTEFRSRAGAAILTAAGITELVAQDKEHYVEIAVSLAEDRTRLAALRSGLRGRLQASGLLDGPRYARELEHCYETALADAAIRD